jgi:hypothetical protein
VVLLYLCLCELTDDRLLLFLIAEILEL